jgi:hypothetical protein
MINKYCSLIFASLIFAISLYGPANAELPPGAYDELKSQASEYIKITILSVKSEESENNCEIEITYAAKVTDVHRSDSVLRADDEITIHSYDRKETPSCMDGWGGPQIPDLLSVGWLGNAYLNPSDSTKGEFDIAAYGQSFEEIDGSGDSDDDNGIKIGCFLDTLKSPTKR